VERHHEAGLQAYPRLYIIHTLSGMMPILCRHCEEPSCAAVCPVKAIIHRDGSILLNESLCIGCKMCAVACPFGVIVPGGTPIPSFEFNVGQYTYFNDPYQPDSMYLREFAVHDRLSLLNWNIGQKTVAVKCDLCNFDERGPACVIACPHKALSLVDEKTDLSRSFVEQLKTASVLEEGES
jgi:hydrogenase-4 component A